MAHFVFESGPSYKNIGALEMVTTQKLVSAPK